MAGSNASGNNLNSKHENPTILEAANEDDDDAEGKNDDSTIFDNDDDENDKEVHLHICL